jgi:hypothetical protein
MKRLLALASVLMFVLCTGCGDTHESLAADSVSTTKEMVSVLDGVKDEVSAKSAKPKLESLMQKLTDIQTRQGKLAVPTEAEVTAMDSKYSKEMEATQEKFMGQMMRIMSDPKLAAVLGDLGSDLGKSKSKK